MPTELAAHAYGHALAVLGREGPAADAAVTALRLGGRSRVAVLAHARHEALAAAPSVGAEDTAEPLPLPATELAAVARALASTRPAVERAIADLEGRHGLDRADLGRVLGLSPSDGAARATAVAQTWERELDPALLAWLGPGDCRDLAVLLSERGLAPAPAPAAEDGGTEAGPAPVEAEPLDPPTLVAGVEAAPAIAAHVAGCEVCTDRRRAMVSVRSLLAQEALESPPAAVRSAAASSRRRPGPPPPPLEPRPQRRLPRWGVAAAAGVLIVVGAAAAAAWRNNGDASHDDRVAELTQVRESGSALILTPAALDPSTAELRISNTSDRPITWRLSTDAGWLDAMPARGLLAPGESTKVSVRLRDEAPEGELRASITVSGDEGSTAGATYAGTFERPPEVSASQQDCLVSAIVEDDGRVTRVVLHWEGGVSGQRTMVQRGDSWVGALSSEDAKVTWYVEATDDRGNSARSPSNELAPGTC